MDISRELVGYGSWVVGIALLVWEYRSNSSALRLLATGLAATFVLLHLDLGPVVRGALASDQPVTTIGDTTVNPYASGVLTMKRYGEGYLQGLWFPTAMLVWLAVSPVLRRLLMHSAATRAGASPPA